MPVASGTSPHLCVRADGHLRIAVHALARATQTSTAQPLNPPKAPMCSATSSPVLCCGPPSNNPPHTSSCTLSDIRKSPAYEGPDRRAHRPRRRHCRAEGQQARASGTRRAKHGEKLSGRRVPRCLRGGQPAAVCKAGGWKTCGYLVVASHNTARRAACDIQCCSVCVCTSGWHRSG
jgi:hypothetical protein